MARTGDTATGRLESGTEIYPGRARERAPKREGRRRQLTVPDDLWESALELAAANGTTPNDALVQLAVAGRDLTDRRARLARVALERQRAYLTSGEHGGDAERPNSKEALHYVGALRRDLATDGE